MFHFQAISQKFDDFQMSIVAGKTTYTAVLQLADEIIACDGPRQNSVLNAKDKLTYVQLLKYSLSGLLMTSYL